MKRITVLVSGRGSNLGALLAAERAGAFDGSVTHVISSRPGAGALDLAREHGVSAEVVDHRAFATREAFDSAIVAAIDRSEPDLVVLAGFMRVLGREAVLRYAGRLINIHPSLLPAYPGLHTHRRALADGAAMHGCTVHFVTPEVDVGPIIAQTALAVRDDDDEASLAARVLELEHRILPAAVGWFCAGRLVIEGSRVHVLGDAASHAARTPGAMR
ncbi:phosphoribosylglycinamide formyltransferase 1 [Burkholderiales bacterium]|nr:phosphoribosylglycinamide formyltransferase 1 [Burkholderiales bacterium]